MFAHDILKTRTAAAHAALDSILSRFDLSDPKSYAAFLQVHARVLPAIEEMLARAPDLPRWGRRAHLLARDLADLGCRSERPMTIGEPVGPAGSLGVLYVVEGSRLGGRMLLRSVGAGLPTRFLSSGHGPGEWRAFLAEMDSRAETAGAPWLERAVSGAELGFQLYTVAATGPRPVA